MSLVRLCLRFSCNPVDIMVQKVQFLYLINPFLPWCQCTRILYLTGLTRKANTSNNFSVLRGCLWPPCVADADYIFALGFFFLLFFFPRLISAVEQSGCLPYFYTWCGLSANLECRSEMCCTWLAENTGRKNRHLRTIAQFCWAISSQLRHVSTIGNKHVKQQYLLHKSLQYGELQPTSSWDRVVSLGHPS